MLPTSAYTNRLPPYPSGSRSGAAAVEKEHPTLLVCVGPGDDTIGASSFTRVAAHTTIEALRAIERTQPRVVAIDWDAEGIDGAVVCAAAKRLAGTGILVVSSGPDRVPSAIKAGCHSVLLRPFVPNLVAARLGRLLREIPTRPAAFLSGMELVGTNRVWPEMQCPACSTGGAMSFEFSSHRRMWYACLSCDQVWIGPRQE
jgi:CheY-like chemotaxis protein